MLDATDMSTPVTRGELREEIAQLETRIDQKLERLETRIDQKLDNLETRIDQKLDNLETRIDQKLDNLGARLDTRLDLWGGALLERLQTELARHTRASQEAMSTEISVIDEKYADLPARVTRLEATVLAPDRR
jgi:exonuclease VII large subunit